MNLKKLKIKSLTLKQKNILNFILNFYAKNNYSPSLQEIADEFGLSAVSTVHKHVDLLIKKGALKKENNQSRGISTFQRTKETVEIPLLGRIAAGQPIEAVEYTETIEVPSYMLRKSGRYYALEVKGDSMIEDDVWDQDIILIKHQEVANKGDMVVASVNNQVTLKRLGNKKGEKIELIPRNPAMKPFQVDYENFEVKGIFAGLIRRAQ